MAETMVFMTPEDARILKAHIEQLKRNPIGTQGRPHVPDDWGNPPETYIAQTPLGGIPSLIFENTGSLIAGEGDEPGYADCVIYRLLSGELKRVGHSQRVYNLSSNPIDEEKWIPVTRDKYGTWLHFGESSSLGTGPTIPVVTNVCDLNTALTWQYFPHNVAADNRWYIAGVETTYPAVSTLGPFMNRIYAMRILPGLGGLLDRIAIYMTLPGVGATGRMGIYDEVGGGDVKPNRLLLDAGTLDLTVSGPVLVSKTITFYRESGTPYWLVFTSNSVTPTIQSFGTTPSGIAPILGSGATFSVAGQGIGWYSAGGGSGALPSTFPAATLATVADNMPIMGFRFSTLGLAPPGGGTVEMIDITLPEGTLIGNKRCFSNPANCCLDSTPGTGTGTDDNNEPGSGDAEIDYPVECTCPICEGGAPHIYWLNGEGFANGTCDKCTDFNRGKTNLIFAGYSGTPCLWQSATLGGGTSYWQLRYDQINDQLVLSGATSCADNFVYTCPRTSWNCKGINVMNRVAGYPHGCGSVPASITIYPGGITDGSNCNNGGGDGGVPMCNCGEYTIPRTLYLTVQKPSTIACPNLDGQEIEINYDDATAKWTGTRPLTGGYTLLGSMYVQANCVMNSGFELYRDGVICASARNTNSITADSPYITCGPTFHLHHEHDLISSGLCPQVCSGMTEPPTGRNYGVWAWDIVP